MSRMLALLNHLKLEAGPATLTMSQLEALNAIQRLWRFPERVNLWGPHGSGKTMVGWAVTRALDAAGYPSPQAFRQQCKQGQPRLVVDNTLHDRDALRTLLAYMQLRDIRTGLLITTEPNPLGLPTVALRLPTVQDIDVVYHNLGLLDYYAAWNVREGDLWAVIHSVL